MGNFQLPCNLTIFMCFQISTWKMLCVMSVVACVLTFATSIIGATSLDPAVKVIGDTRSGTAAKLNLKVNRLKHLHRKQQ